MQSCPEKHITKLYISITELASYGKSLDLLHFISTLGLSPKVVRVSFLTSNQARPALGSRNAETTQKRGCAADITFYQPPELLFRVLAPRK